MKKLLLFTLAVAMQPAMAQQATFTSVFYDSLSAGIESRAMAKTLDNGYIVAGKTNYYMGYLLKTDSAGNYVWNKFFNPSPTSYIEFNAITATSDSNFVIGGMLINNGISYALCGKINALGDTVWIKTYERAGDGLAVYSIAQTFDGGYILTGASSFNVAPYTKLLIIKINANGNLQWMQTMEGNNYYNSGYAVKQDADSNYVVTGLLEEYIPPGTFNEGTLLSKLSQTGVVLWAKKYSPSQQVLALGYDFNITPGGYVCFGNSGGFDALIKTDFSGNVLWANSYAPNFPNPINASMPKISGTDDGGFVFISGSCFGPNILCKVDSIGSSLWSSSLTLVATEATETNNREIFIVGNGPLCGVRTTQVLFPQIGVIQTDSLGTMPNAQCVFLNTIVPAAFIPVVSNLSFTVLQGGVENSYSTIVGTPLLVSYNGCVDFTGGTEEHNLGNLNIFPNPATDYVTIITNKNHYFSKSIFELNDVLGKNVFSKTINDNAEKISVKAIKPGIYFYTLKNEKGAAVFGKLVIK